MQYKSLPEEGEGGMAVPATRPRGGIMGLVIPSTDSGKRTGLHDDGAEMLEDYKNPRVVGEDMISLQSAECAEMVPSIPSFGRHCSISVP